METGDTIEALCDQAARLCRRLAPVELPPDLPIYVVAQSTLSEPWQRSKAGGYVDPRLDLLLRPELGDRFIGRGPAMIVNDGRKTDHAASDASEIGAHDGYIATRVAQSFLATVIHELAHILDLGYRFAPIADSEETLSARRAEMLESLDRPNNEFHVAGEPPWFQHAATFVRVLLHLECRAKRLDDALPSPSFHHDFYELSPLGVYRRALGDEPARMVDASFAEIKAEPLPEYFEFIFLRDVSRWERQQAAATENAAATLEPLEV